MARRWRSLAFLWVAGCCLAATAPASPAAPIAQLIPQPGTDRCVSADAGSHCRSGVAIGFPGPVAVSPDGRSVYLGSYDIDPDPSQLAGAIAVFDRGPKGRLSQKPGAAACVSELVSVPCGYAHPLGGVSSIAVSPDGQNLYAGSVLHQAVAVFDRADDGSLQQKPGPAGCLGLHCSPVTGLFPATAVALSPDGRNLYVSSSTGPEGAVAVLDRGPDGALTQRPGAGGCLAQGVPACTPGRALGFAEALAVSPDGRSVYVVGSEGLAILDRAADGSLSQREGAAGCVSTTGVPSCATGRSLWGLYSVAVSPDGRNVYLGGADIAIFDRAADGSVSQKPGPAGCISATLPCTLGRVVGDVLGIAVSPDGSAVYAASLAADGVMALKRGPDGTLSQGPGARGCISHSGVGGCGRTAGLDGPNGIALSRDGRNAYVASGVSRAVASLDRLCGRVELAVSGHRPKRPHGGRGKQLGVRLRLRVKPAAVLSLKVRVEPRPNGRRAHGPAAAGVPAKRVRVRGSRPIRLPLPRKLAARLGPDDPVTLRVSSRGRPLRRGCAKQASQRLRLETRVRWIGADLPGKPALAGARSAGGTG